MQKELTESQVIAKFEELQKMANCLGLRIENRNGLNVCYNESVVNHYNSLHEVEVFLSGYKACQMHEAAEKNG